MSFPADVITHHPSPRAHDVARHICPQRRARHARFPGHSDGVFWARPGHVAGAEGLGPVERRLPSRPRRSNQNRAPGVSAMTVIAKPMRTSTTSQPEPPLGLRIPRWSSQLHDVFGFAQAATVAHPIGSPPCAAADRWACRPARQSCWFWPWQEVVFAATLLTAVPMTLLLYSVRPIVSVLMLSSSTRMAPMTSVIL